MKLPIDTHILLDSPSLTDRVRGLIADPENTVFVSAVSMWEIWLKQSLGKLQLPSNFAEKLADESFEGLPLVAAHTREVASLPWHHRDPFDRMLIAQARSAGLKFVTADAMAGDYGDFVLLVR